MPDRPVFLERQTYRMRRLMDAVRLLPFLGLALWMVPLMWPYPEVSPDADGITTGVALRYIFGVWLGLVLAGFMLWHRTRTQPSSQQAETQD